MKRTVTNTVRNRVSTFGKKAERFKRWVYNEIEKCEDQKNADREYEFNCHVQTAMEKVLDKIDIIFKQELYGRTKK